MPVTDPSSPAAGPAGPPAELLAARDGTGTAFPAALAAHARARGASALDDAGAWWAGADPVARLVGLELSAVLAGAASPLPVEQRGPARAQVASQAGQAARAPDPDLRWAAAKALGGIGPSAAAVRALLLLVADDDADVRWQAVSCLPLAGTGDDVVDALVTATADPDPDVAEQAVFVLAEQLEPTGPAAGQRVADALAAHLRADDADGTASPDGTDDAQGPPAAALAALGLARRDDARAEPAVAAVLASALGAVRSGADPDAVAELDEPWLQAAELLPQLAPLLADVRASAT